MALIEIKKESDKQAERQELLSVISDYISDRGFIVYPGHKSAEDRTGSPVQSLVDWHLFKQGLKPYDYDIFKTFLNDLIK